MKIFSLALIASLPLTSMAASSTLDPSGAQIEFITDESSPPDLGQGYSIGSRGLLSQCLQNGDSATKAYKTLRDSHYTNVRYRAGETGYSADLDLPSVAGQINKIITPAASTGDALTQEAGTDKIDALSGKLFQGLNHRFSGKYEYINAHYFLTKVLKLSQPEIQTKFENAGTNGAKSIKDPVGFYRVCGEQYVDSIAYGFSATRKITIEMSREHLNGGVNLTKALKSIFPAEQMLPSIGISTKNDNTNAVITLRQDYTGLRIADAMQNDADQSEIDNSIGDVIPCIFDPAEFSSGPNKSSTSSCLTILTKGEELLDTARLKYFEKLAAKLAKADPNAKEGDESVASKASVPIFYTTANYAEHMIDFKSLPTLPIEVDQARAFVNAKLNLINQYSQIIQEARSTELVRNKLFSGVRRLRRIEKLQSKALEVQGIAKSAFVACNTYRIYNEPEQSQVLSGDERALQNAFTSETTSDEKKLSGIGICLKYRNLLSDEMDQFKLPATLHIKKVNLVDGKVDGGGAAGLTN